MLSLLRRWRRNRLRSASIPDALRRVMDQRVPLIGRLPGDLRAELDHLTHAFLREKRFEGAQGQEVTDEVRVVIGATACLLLVGMPDHDLFPLMRTVIVYPSAYRAVGRQALGNGLVLESEGVRLGESWQRGPVVIAWDAARQGVASPGDGRNVVLHEFAHQLDAEFAGMEGAPALRSRRDYKDWARVLGAEYERLRDRLRSGSRTLIDSYGATNPAEFFAVVTEAFYERPRDLREVHPELYEQFARFYGVDPASWDLQ